MDANGIRFHMLLGKDDWLRCSSNDESLPVLPAPVAASPPAEVENTQFYWDNDRNEVMLQPSLFEFASSPFDIKPTLASRRGAGCDRFGNWFWIDESEENILVNSAGTQMTSHFWASTDTTDCGGVEDEAGFKPALAPSPAAPLKLSGLAVTEDHYLVVGTVQPAGLLIFDLYGGGPPQRMMMPAHFTPFDMAPRHGGGVLILDRNNSSFWALDRSFRTCPVAEQGIGVQEEWFQPRGGMTRRKIPEAMLLQGVSFAVVSPAKEIDPIAIESLPDGTVLILDRNEQGKLSGIYRYSLSGAPIGFASTEVIVTRMFNGKREDFTPIRIVNGKREDFTLTGHDMAFVPDQGGTEVPKKGRLYVADNDGNQSLVFTLTYDNTDLKVEFLNEYLPMRLFGGKGIVTSGSQVYYDFSDRWIPLIRQNRPRYQESATLYTPIKSHFDGREPDCVWHRLLLDACIPPETQVEIWSRAANQLEELQTAEWQKEPIPCRRSNGSELPFMQTATDIETWETLFQKARGRYLQLKITLTGNGRATPRLRALRIYYPRFSYLDHYLPSVYQENSLSASFLERFLANLEGIYTSIEDKIAEAQILFDPQSVPPEALDWLAGWFGITLDRSWDENRQRLFIKHAMVFFNCRGTIRGLQMALRLALDECVDETIFTDATMKNVQQSPIRIVERFRTRRTPGIVFGDTGITESGPGIVTSAQRWTPDQKKDELRRRYSRFLEPQTEKGPKLKDFPISTPEDAEKAVLWRQFSQETLGFVPSAGKNDLKLWQDFIARRYRTIAELNIQYYSSWTSFDVVPFPSALPADGAPLLDWYQFESVVLPMRRNAHQFTVLLPTPRSVTADTAEYQRRLELARRIVELEKPSHTVFSVNFYWAMFRVGEARVGYDTVVDLGSRAPEFMAAMVLGRQHIGESFIGSLQPQLQDRYTLGETELK